MIIAALLAIDGNQKFNCIKIMLFQSTKVA
jgi:hypothetical protein